MDGPKLHSVKLKKTSSRLSSRHNTSKCSVETVPKSPKVGSQHKKVSHRSKSPKTQTISIDFPKELLPPSDKARYHPAKLHLPLSKLKTDISQEPWSLSSAGDNIGVVPVKLVSHDRKVPQYVPGLQSTTRESRAGSPMRRLSSTDSYNKSTGYRAAPDQLSSLRENQKYASESQRVSGAPASRSDVRPLTQRSVERLNRTPNTTSAGSAPFKDLDRTDEYRDCRLPTNPQGLTFADNHRDSQIKQERESFSPQIAENRRFIDMVTECLCRTFSKGLSHECQHLTQKVLDALKSGELNYFRSTFTEYLDFLRTRDVCQTHQNQKLLSVQNDLDRLFDYSQKLQRALSDLVDLTKIIVSPICDKPIAMYTKRIELGRKISELEHSEYLTKLTPSKNGSAGIFAANTENIDPRTTTMNFQGLFSPKPTVLSDQYWSSQGPVNHHLNRHQTCPDTSLPQFAGHTPYCSHEQSRDLRR